VDNDLALKIYIKARATPKVVAAFAERREFDKILVYSKQVLCLFIREYIEFDAKLLKCYYSSNLLETFGPEYFYFLFVVAIGWVHT